MRVPETDPALATSHAYCHGVTRRHARSFYFASVALPAEKKRAAYAVYAFCRYADDLVDRQTGKDGIGTVLAGIGEDFDRIRAGKRRDLPFALAFAWAVNRYGLEKQPFLDLLKGVATDLGPVRIADWPQLRDYGYHVASVVGLMMAQIFELRDPAAREQAIELGLAMQLTNIIRDVGEDLAMGRVYLPADELAAAGLGVEDLRAPRTGPALREFLRGQIQRARDFYASAERGIPRLADDGSQYTVWLMRHVYAGILDEVERADYQILHRRVSTSLGRKLRLAARAWLAYRRTRRER